MKSHQLTALLVAILYLNLSSCADKNPSPETIPANPANSISASERENAVDAATLATMSILRKSGIQNIVEISGGFKLLCRSFPAQKYWIINARESRVTKGCENIELKTSDFYDLKKSDLNLPENFALVALGVDLWAKKLPRRAEILKELVEKAQIVIVEAPINEFRRRYQGNEIINMALDKQKTIVVDAEISNMRGKDPDTRRLTVLRSPTATFGKEPTQQCDAENANRWKYLWANHSLNLRQGIAADYLKAEGINNIVEVGGFCTPLCNYLPDSKYTNVDPFVHSTTSYECNNAELVKQGVEAVDFGTLKINKPFAVAMFGLYWEFLRGQNAADIPFVKNSLQEAKVLIIEAVPNVNFLEKHFAQIISYAKRLGFQEQLSVNINVVGEQPDAFAYYRRMIIMKKP